MTPIIANSQVTTRSLVCRYDNIIGDRIVFGTNLKNYTYVTCSHTSDDRSCFIVKNLKRSVTKAFYTTQHVTPIPGRHNIGYLVSDIDVHQSVCWFCGTKWEETGGYVYDPNGLAYPETIFCSYVGWFNMFDALDNGGGYFNIVEFNNVYNFNLKKLVAEDSYYIVAIADNKILELYNYQNNSFSYRIGSTTWGDETFQDVAIAGDTVITLSRFYDTSYYFYYHDYFSLRYGQVLNFINNNHQYPYDTYYLVGNDTWARFRDIDPIKMTHMCTDNDVVISYLASYSDQNTIYPIPGHIVMFHIPNAGIYPSENINSTDSYTYRTLKDADKSACYGTETCMALLMDDSTGMQVLRYPILGRGYGSYMDTIKRISSPCLDAIAMGRAYNDNKYWLTAAGTFLANNKVAEVQDLDIRSSGVPSRPLSCFNIVHGSFYSGESNTFLPVMNRPLNYSVGSKPVLSYQYTSFDVQKTNTCRNGLIPISSGEPEISE